MLRYNPTGVGLSAPQPGSLRLLQLQGLWITGAPPAAEALGLKALQLQGLWVNSAPPTGTAAGLKALQLQGLWVNSAPSDAVVDPGKHIAFASDGQRRRKDEEEILIILQGFMNCL